MSDDNRASRAGHHHFDLAVRPSTGDSRCPSQTNPFQTASMATGQTTSKVTADLKRNRLVITISATASGKEANRIYTDIRFCVADLKPGFSVVTDFTRCTLAHLSAISTMRQIMEFLVTRQPGVIIRVVGKNSLVFKQLLRFIRLYQSYKPIYVNTLDEAEEVLTRLTQREGLRYQLFDHLVEFTVDNEKKSGKLIDISISGCAIEDPAPSLVTGQEISIVIPIGHGDGLPDSFRSSARIVRVRDDHFAVQFLDLDQGRKECLHRWFLHEIRQQGAHPEQADIEEQ